jgi:hypothetical protein
MERRQVERQHLVRQDVTDSFFRFFFGDLLQNVSTKGCQLVFANRLERPRFSFKCSDPCFVTEIGVTRLVVSLKKIWANSRSQGRQLAAYGE